MFQPKNNSRKTTHRVLEIFMQNGKVGEGDIFSKENVFIALIA
jgi:hypothetical protein